MWWNGAKFEELIIRLALVLNMWGGKYKFVMQMVVEFKHNFFLETNSQSWIFAQ
jgi:hypothetical protein